MQTAQLTFNSRTITEFFAVLFLFRCPEKIRDLPNSPRSVICGDLFLYFFGDTLVLQIGDTISPRYTALKISAISYLFRTFSLLIMGDTERPRYTRFRGLSVRGITALQCIWCIQLKTIQRILLRFYLTKYLYKNSPTFQDVNFMLGRQQLLQFTAYLLK